MVAVIRGPEILSLLQGFQSIGILAKKKKKGKKNVPVDFENCELQLGLQFPDFL